MNNNDIYWLAGYLEGEGCFLTNRCAKPWTARSPRIQVNTTDRDIAVRVAKILRGSLLGPYTNKTQANRKLVWRIDLNGGPAAGWMMTLYTLMGNRRKAAIKERLRVWRNK